VFTVLSAITMAPASNLSPAAQAVLDAAFTLADNLDRDVTEAEMIAAALRAAADHIYHDWSAFNCIDALCEIAAELETFATENDD
jgi:hypothetical protein